MKLWCVRLLMRCAKWLDADYLGCCYGVHGVMRREALDLVETYEKYIGVSPEYKRNEAYAKLCKAYPKCRRRICAMAIELAVAECLD